MNNAPEQSKNSAGSLDGLARLAAWEQMSLPVDVWSQEQRESFARIVRERNGSSNDEHVQPAAATKTTLEADTLSKEMLDGLAKLAAWEQQR